MQTAVTKAVNMAERKEGREGKGPDPQQRKHSNTAGKREETNAQEAKHWQVRLDLELYRFNHMEVNQGPTSVGVDYGLRLRVSTVEK